MALLLSHSGNPVFIELKWEQKVISLIQSPKVLPMLNLQAWGCKAIVALRVATMCLHQAERNKDLKQKQYSRLCCSSLD